MRTGIRLVQLLDKSFKPIEGVGILVRVEINTLRREEQY